MSSDFIVIGRFGAPHGIKGAIKLYSLTRPKENLLHYSSLFIKKQEKAASFEPVSLKIQERSGDFYLAYLSACHDRDVAKTYTHAELAIQADALPTLETDRYYWRDLIGLNVINLKNESLGQIVEMIETGSNDVFIVKGEQEHALPFRQEVILEIDLKEKIMRVDWDKDF